MFVSGPQADLFGKSAVRNKIKVAFIYGLKSKWTGNDDRL